MILTYYVSICLIYKYQHTGTCLYWSCIIYVIHLYARILVLLITAVQIQYGTKIIEKTSEDEPFLHIFIVTVQKVRKYSDEEPNTQDYKQFGCIYGILIKKQDVCTPSQLWNTQEPTVVFIFLCILLKSSLQVVWLRGNVLYDINIYCVNVYWQVLENFYDQKSFLLCYLLSNSQIFTSNVSILVVLSEAHDSLLDMWDQCIVVSKWMCLPKLLVVCLNSRACALLAIIFNFCLLLPPPSPPKKRIT